MEVFENISDQGNELAIRRGVRVPDGAVNLSWVKAPALTPDKNVIVIDTSQVTPENVDQVGRVCQLMYANGLGILEDIFGNQIVDEEYPAVTDVFTVEEDWITTPGNEYADANILPYVHRSRYFHLDYPELTLGTLEQTYDSEVIKVVHADGSEYVDNDGKKRYKIKIVPALINPSGVGSSTSTSLDNTNTDGVYRVHAYIDTDQGENLYLKYSKVELSPTGERKNHRIDYKEIINPLTYYEYIPEESDVVDPANRNKRIYSSKPVGLKEQIIGVPQASVDGYRIYVPRKAIMDPREFQLFRWRVKCEFVEHYTVDPINERGRINVGFIQPNGVEDLSGVYAFYNTMVSHYNATGVDFVNPISERMATPIPKTSAAYWIVNPDIVSNDELKDFDLLMWAPRNEQFNFQPYMGMIKYFVENTGGTMLIDFGNRCQPVNLGVTLSAPWNGFAKTKIFNGPDSKVIGSTISVVDKQHDLFNGQKIGGGWNFNDGTDDEYNTINMFKAGSSYASSYHKDPAWCQHIMSLPNGFTQLVEAKTPGSVRKDMMIVKDYPSGERTGHLIISTLDIPNIVGGLSHPITGARVSANVGRDILSIASPLAMRLLAGQDIGYGDLLRSSLEEGARKLFFNIALNAVKGKIVDSSDEERYSSSWSTYSEWRPSWVINASDDVLSQYEIETNDFYLLPKTSTDPEPAWLRRLSESKLRELIESRMTASDLNKVRGMDRKYSIETTNRNVSVPDDVDGDSRPYAWTEVYSPKFNIPFELGPNVVRDESIRGDYADGQYTKYSYPTRPYRLQARMEFVKSVQQLDTETVTITITGTALETSYRKTPLTSSIKEITWDDGGYGGTFQSPFLFEFGAPRANGVSTWSQANYHGWVYGNGNLAFPASGIEGRYTYGSSGMVVKWIQDVLNRLRNLGAIPLGAGAVDGKFGAGTAAAVNAMENLLQLRYRNDSSVDAEMSSALSNQVLRFQAVGEMPTGGPDYMDLYRWVALRAKNTQISQKHNGGESYSLRTWHTNGPPIIHSGFFVQTPRTYPIHMILVTPWMNGATKHITVTGADVLNIGNTSLTTALQGFAYTSLRVRPNIVAGHNQVTRIGVGPWEGNVFCVSLMNNRGYSGYGTSLELGIQNMSALAQVVSGGDVKTYTREVTIRDTVTFNVSTGKPVIYQLKPREILEGSTYVPLYKDRTYTDVKWAQVTSNNSQVVVDLNKLAHTVRAYHTDMDIALSDNITAGPMLPYNAFVNDEELPDYLDNEGNILGSKSVQALVGLTTFYSMDEHRRVSPIPETGIISKLDGIKLICKKDGTPYGFPFLPNGPWDSEAQRHYTTYSIDRAGTDSSITVGFYDIVNQEFIIDSNGMPNMTYQEYLSRGPQNIYIGLISTYEEKTDVPFPPADDAPPIPFRMAMPVYGLCSNRGTRISLEPLPSGLGPTDLWSLPVKTGKFTRSVTVRSRVEAPLTNWLKNYEGSLVKAYYSIPESELGGWSQIYGRPYYDVVGETPTVISSTAIKVAQPPILVRREETIWGTLADPSRPVLKVYTRGSVSEPWVELNRDQIADYNAVNGFVYLKNELPYADPSLVKVDYTTSRRTYQFKQFDGQRLNLNPYPGHNRDLMGVPIYVYILPAYVKDSYNRIITESVQSRAIRFTTDKSIFDQLSPDYDQLAVLLGVVYMTNALDINDLIMLDTRRRGGGASDNYTNSELQNLLQDVSSYWDIGFGSGQTYQAGGFIIIRLPRQLQIMFPDESEIVKVIERNITAGVRYKIEDLEGNDWS